jgi:general secretion pathway protein E
MVHEDFNQIAVRPQVGITFGSIMRNILRQDPDIIMIGELRDLETGRKRHSGGAHRTFGDVDPAHQRCPVIDCPDDGSGGALFSPPGDTRGILSQRLVRKICNACKEPVEIDAVKLQALGLETGQSGIVVTLPWQGVPEMQREPAIREEPLFMKCFPIPMPSKF